MNITGEYPKPWTDKVVAVVAVAGLYPGPARGVVVPSDASDDAVTVRPVDPGR
jgi:hypothetical protein